MLGDIIRFLAIEKSLISLLPLKGCEFGYQGKLVSSFVGMD
ncbi:hypothetical protein HPYSS1_01761 [Helicobacter pylori SS1]|nr:hypothetical protein HPYSS1_01761 [Helicobacter pylori SS1]